MKEENVIYRIIDGKGENRRLDRRYVFIGIFVFIMIATFSFLLTRNMRQTSAADMSQFKAGNIMSDAVMRNYASMSETEIQSFSKKKKKKKFNNRCNPSCKCCVLNCYFERSQETVSSTSFCYVGILGQTGTRAERES